MSIRPRNPFGSGPVRPAQEAPEEMEADGGLFEAGGVNEEEDLELSSTGSLTSISIRRKRSGAKLAVQPRASVPRPQDTPPRNIVEFWSRLKKGRRWPTRGELDAKQIGMHWPNSVLMRVGENGQPWQFEPLMAEVLRGSGQSFHTGEIEFGNSLVMEWILGLGRRTQSSLRPQEDADSFPINSGDVRYRAMTVPLGGDDDKVTHVLCHVVKM